MIFMKESCVDFERENNTTLVLLLSNCLHTLQFYDWPFKYYFWWFW